MKMKINLPTTFIICAIFVGVVLPAYGQSDTSIADDKMALLDGIVGQLRDGLKEKNEAISALKKENNRLSVELNIIHQSNIELTKSIEQLKNAISELKKRDVSLSSQELIDLKEELRGKLKEIDEKEKMIQNVNTKRAVISKELLETKNQLNKIETELFNLKNRTTIKPLIKDEIKEKFQSENKRIVQLQEENIFLNKRITRADKKVNSMQKELISVKNAYLEREDAIPGAIAATSLKYQDQIEKLKIYIKQLEGELKQKSGVIEHVSEKHGLATGYLTKAESEIGKYQKQIEELKIQIKNNEEGSEELVRASKDYQSNYSKLEKKYLGLEEEMARLVKTHKESMDNLRDELKNIRSASKSNEKSAQSLIEEKQNEAKKSLALLQSKLDNLKNEKNIALERIDKLTNELDDLVDDNKKLNQRIVKLKENETALTNELKKKDAEYAKTTKKLEESYDISSNIESELTEIRKANDGLTVQLSKLKEEMQKKDNIIQESEAAINKNLEAKVDEIKLLKEENAVLSKNLQLQKDIKAQYQEEARLIQAKLSKRELSVDKNAALIVTQREQFDQKIVKKDEYIKILQSKINDYQQKNDTLADQFDLLKEKVTNLENELQVAKNSVGIENSAQKRKLLGKVHSLEGEIKAFEKKIDVKEAEIKRVQGENELLLQELIESKDKRIALNKELFKLNEQLLNIKQQRSVKEFDDGPLNEKMENLTRQLLASENVIYEKELIIEGLQQTHKKLTRALNIAEENNQLLKRELENLKAEEYSFKEKNSVMDIQLNEIEKSIREKLNTGQ